jgi:GH15 family glucan-1,4-alpha-glucosidase
MGERPRSIARSAVHLTRSACCVLVVVEVECQPAFNYARDAHEVQIVTHGARFKSDKLSMVLTSSKKRVWVVTPRNGVQTKLKLVEGQKAVFIFRESKSPSAYPNEDPTKHDITGHPATEEFTEHLKVSTIEYWRSWIAKCTYTGRWREAVYRSALVLKLLTFEPTGAIVAAATTSLPETIGGARNWDYRFSWIRDSSFVLYAFIKLGFREEAAAFMGWIAKRCEESSKGDGSLQIMYGLHGEHKLEELELDHLSGYMDSKPVRIGNGAYDQVQLVSDTLHSRFVSCCVFEVCDTHADVSMHCAHSCSGYLR